MREALPLESPVLLSPCFAYGVGFRIARCFSACARTMHLAGAWIQHPMLRMRCRLPQRTVLLSLWKASTPSTSSTSRSEPPCPVLPLETSVLLTPCLAYGVAFRTARCFSACARTRNLASTPSSVVPCKW